MPAPFDPVADAITLRENSCQPLSYAALSKSTGIPSATLCHRQNGRMTRQAAAAHRQYLTPTEEDGLEDYILDAKKRGIRIPNKSLPYLASNIVRRRSSTFQTLASETDVKPPGQDWIKAYLKRHPGLIGRRSKALEWARFDIYDKVVEWFEVIGPLLHGNPDILPENVYNMDETGTRLCVPRSRKYIVAKDDRTDVKGPKTNRVQVTTLECISADGKSLHPFVIWPGSTLRSDWTIHETPGWHFGCSDSGYSNRKTMLEWYQKVFDPQTRGCANGKPRVLISDGYGSHEAPEVLKFCCENTAVFNCGFGFRTYTFTLRPIIRSTRDP